MFKKLIAKNNSNVANLLAGRIATNIADSLFYMTILWYFKVHFHSPIVLSLVFIADSTIDMMAFVFGPLIDRIYIKRLLQYVTAFQILFSFITVGFFLNKNEQNIFIIVGLIITYIFSTIGSTLIYPSEEKILPVITDRNQLIKINGIFQMTYQTLDLFLDSLATLLITYLSINNTMVISALIFAIALAFYSKLFLPKKLFKQTSDYFADNYLKDLITGWKTLKNEDRILALILPFAITNLFYGIASVGLPYFASNFISKNASGYGMIEFACSLGGILRSIIIQHFNFGKEKLEEFVTLSLLLAGISVILQAILAKLLFSWILILFVSSSVWISMMNINFKVLVQESFDSQILGRIETINTSIINCMIPLGSFLGGIIVQHYSATEAILMQGIAEVITAFFYFLIFIKNR
ncbi:MFS transporter [Lactobacillus hominis]|uniref:Macrolide efflux protein n=1 Tax=Lactobacillus hominis DSM 23910 = CRBIP 24.179 TaxID=1423758 RepID=I7L909_9LACO|nr:MFS transporter [Lactobacillus hominis]KRM85966.1 macrolide efflux protein [Lactobacillus hominis DSM 23910 = CRBIP 24.179]MCT3348804.1 MFS transporter [Lactobacillus hominis]CCI81079.1 Macrolide efflux protein [Lactobacillus hominis DSM 23910 = CRBIP 24.179]